MFGFHLLQTFDYREVKDGRNCVYIGYVLLNRWREDHYDTRERGRERERKIQTKVLSQHLRRDKRKEKKKKEKKIVAARTSGKICAGVSNVGWLLEKRLI